MRKLTIWDIIERTSETSPYFFSTATLKFFGQTRSSFKVYKQDDGRYLISAPMKSSGKIVGYTERYFNPENNKLELN
jgi:hypothetical protein